MEILSLTHPYSDNDIFHGSIVLALGFFDGVHRGHQAVIKKAKNIAKQRQLPLAVMTFNQHPKIVYQALDPTSVSYLTLNDQKMALFDSLGVDIVYMVDYTHDFGMLSPQAFVDEYIVKLHAQVVVAGFDYTYGKPDLANMTTLPIHAKERFEVIKVDALTAMKEKVASTRIKQLVESGEIALANDLLGYCYQTQGEVVHGNKRGRLLGFPTANIAIHPQKIMPKIGVYVVKIAIQGKWYQAMASIGHNVTFEANRPKTCEVYVLDFDQMIYGEIVQVEWLYYLRDEKRFENIEGLIEQLNKDLFETKAYFLQKEKDHE